MQIKILVADDSATDRMIIKNILSDYCVLTARDGEETIRMLEEHDGINLLILDLNMPKMDGFQVLEYIKENERYKNLRTIILTIYDEADNEIAGLKLGAVDYIRKPINMAAFKARIDVHVEFLRTEAALKQQLEESERSKYVLLTHLPGLAYRCNYDRDWTMQYVSEGCYDLTGYPPESLLYNRDLSFNELISPEYRELLWNEWKRILKERKPFKYEYEIITAAGEKKWVLEMGQGIYNDKGEVEALEGIVLDISDRKAVEDALKYNNEHDKWTGLYNREYLLQLLERDAKLKKKSKKALIGINLSMVQLLTATYGHQYSRNLIKKAAEALGRYCSSNRILFYPHENRFIFYLYDYEDKKELVDFSSAVAETLKSLFVAERIGGGIGIVEIEPDQDELDIDLLLRKLMIASERYVSMLGRDFELCFYDEELEAVVSRERDIIEALSAIAADDYTDNELFLLYQPILDLRTGSICGFEALARLRTKKLGIVSPLEFIPIAEKTKLILPIGEKVFAKALGFLKSLDELGYDGIFVSINISAIQLFSPDFTSSLFELISKVKVNPKNVSIEITESVIASDYDSINEIIKKLRSIGIRIAIDDFGTGHSSLAREKGLKADCMKIDRYFVDKLLYTDHNKAITSDIISIAHKLGQCTIAEGVEQEGQLQYLKKYNCDMVQGYLISEPLDEDKAIVFLKDKDKSWQ